MYSLNRIIRTINLIALTLGCFGLSPQAQAVCQQGCGGDVGNTFLGEDALLNNFGVWNTAVGFKALANNDTTATANTAVGFEALMGNTGGDLNTALGSNALFNNTTGGSNTAVGSIALANNTTGNANTAVGATALYVNTTGFANTAIGHGALDINTVGVWNTATGNAALSRNTTGSNNIAVGVLAGGALTTGDDNIDIGNAGLTGESGKIRIGTPGTQTATYIAGIRNAPLAHGVAVGVGITADGQLGVRASSERFKEAIKPMDKTSEAILALKPVTFHYKKEFDPKGAPQFGLVAEEVAKVNPDLVVADDQGKPFTVRYDEVNAMLLNEFLKEHHKVEEQGDRQQKLEATVAQQQQEIQALTATLKAQAAQIQKVSDELGAQAPAPRVVAND
jgi:hypothetical protein